MNLIKNSLALLIAGTLGMSPALAETQPSANTIPIPSIADSKAIPSPVIRVAARRAQGLSGSIVPVKVYRGFGQTIINFRPTKEQIRQVTLGDSSKVALNSDDPECLVNKAESEAHRCHATVLYLRRIDLPQQFQTALIDSGLPTAPKTRLTVLTDNDNPYIFEITYADGEPEYSVVTIQPDATGSDRQSNSTSVMTTAIEHLNVLSRGYRIALEQKIVPLELDTRIRNFLSLVQANAPVDRAAYTAGISTQVVSKLAELGQGSFEPRTQSQPITIPWIQQPTSQ
ncbi:hypothetical protein B7486_49170 [cyanobacterium TDX16]|nr:hypothetical protein B7486_49170 [cyanobacterium TDX16]